MQPIRTFLILIGVVAFAGCTQAFVSTWRSPDAQPLQLKGSKVAAVVMMRNKASRREAENVLANAISARGARGIPMYQLLPDGSPQTEAAARSVLEKEGFAGAVVIRPVSVDKEIVSTPVTYSGPSYGSYWGGYYGHGWGSPYGGGMVTGGEIRTNTIVSIETLIYSLRQNKLVWGAQSRTTNPRDVDKVVKKLAGDVAKALQEQGLIAATP